MFNKLIFILVITATITSCGVDSELKYKNRKKGNIEYIVKMYDHSEMNQLEQVNKIRSTAGLSLFSKDDKLEEAAINHSLYLVENKVAGHYENSNNSKYTGYAPLDRTAYAGYNNSIVGEVVTNINGLPDVNSKKPLELLMSAIYHRLALLSFKYSNIGIGVATSKELSSYVYDLGMSQVVSYCDSDLDFKSGYVDVCLYNNKLLDSSIYDYNKINNEFMVVYPYDGQLDADCVFYEEDPDPLPLCNVSGYPISISFNDSKVKSVELKDFTLLENGVSDVKEMTVLSNDNDKKIDKNTYVFFPLKRLKYDTKYVAIVKYIIQGLEYTHSWQFKTKSVGYPVVNEMKTLLTDHVYVIYEEPNVCNNNYDYAVTRTDTIMLDFLDSDTIIIKPTKIEDNAIIKTNKKTYMFNIR